MLIRKLAARAALLLSLLLPLVNTAQADLLIIVHPDNTDSIDAKFVKNLYLGKIDHFPSGHEALPIMLPERNALTELFLDKVIEQSAVQFKRLWSKNLFTGKGTPPTEVLSDNEVMQMVMSNPAMIGFIDADNYTNEVRKVLRLKTGD